MKKSVINIRSFGSDPQFVSDMDAECIKGLKSESIVTVFRRFPSHGAPTATPVFL
ncbi:MAG: hypothetical protein IKN66_06315 [Ruminococcus sp.]|nr:hypothetical protein [Ruminococcus sp.]